MAFEDCTNLKIIELSRCWKKGNAFRNVHGRLRYRD
jgi:hypothetical protein